MQLTNEKKKPIVSIVFFMIATVYLAYDFFYAFPKVGSGGVPVDYIARCFNIIVQKLIFLCLEILLIIALLKSRRIRFLGVAICLIPLVRIIFGSS